jgi:hypothetical protein
MALPIFTPTLAESRGVGRRTDCLILTQVIRQEQYVLSVEHDGIEQDVVEHEDLSVEHEIVEKNQARHY